MHVLKLEWENVAWLNITTAVASFPWVGLPDDVHVSISYHPENDMMNVHLSRNVPGVPPEDKPKIRIAQWPKSEMEGVMQILLYRYWQRMWPPFDMAKYQYRLSAKGQGARYFPITKLLKPGKGHFLHRQLKDHFVQHSRRKRKGRHVVIQKELMPTLEQLVFRPKFFWKLMDEFRRVPRKFSGHTEIGYLYANDFSGLVCRVRGQWFMYRQETDFQVIFQDFFEPDVYKAIIEKFAEAISVISQATTKIDTLRYSKPIDLAIIQ